MSFLTYTKEKIDQLLLPLVALKAGGTTGQVLAKSSSSDYDTVWVTPSSGGGTITAASITDSSAVGRSVLTAPDAATARGDIGAGTSSLVLGATAGTAKAGDWKPVSADIADLSESVQDTVAALLVAGTGITLTYDDAGNLLTVSTPAVLPARQISTGTGLSGGGDLSADRTLSVQYGAAAGTAVQGNDARVTADQAAGTASIRTLGTGSQQAAAGNHTHPGMVTGTGITNVVQITQANFTALATPDVNTLYLIVG